MSMSRALRSGSGGRQFAVGGPWRHVAVVDSGCGCRPRRPRLPLMSLPSFLRPSAPKPPAPESSSSSRSSSFFPSSASTASSATYSSHSSSSNYHANVVSYKQNQAPTVPYGVTAKASAPAQVARKKAAGGGKTRKRREKPAAVEEGDDDGVGVAVEKESSDPRADFRDSMVHMVVEMGLCDWDGLRCMLRRLLALNAPRHHAAILTAFAEVCAQLASEPPPQPPAYHYDYYY